MIIFELSLTTLEAAGVVSKNWLEPKTKPTDSIEFKHHSVPKKLSDLGCLDLFNTNTMSFSVRT